MKSIEVRAAIYAQIRDFFAHRNILEVDTPILNLYTVTDQHLDSFCIANTKHSAFLHTSPEYAMKRLLVEYKCDIYQLCKVFRREELGMRHHTEFTMLEWYRVAWNYHELMQEVDELVKILFAENINLLDTEFITYKNAFEKYCAIDPHQSNEADYIKICSEHGISLNSQLSIQSYQELLLDQVIVKNLAKSQLTFIYDFPAEQAALARINKQGMAERFELYFGDIELANGFQELTDAKEQLGRFQKDNIKRKKSGKEEIEIDTQFIKALELGMPSSSGVALGVDRLLMIILGVKDIKSTLYLHEQI